jgi:hypothetical protein
VLRRFDVEFELRGTSQEAVVYRVTAPYDIGTEAVTQALTALVPDGKCAVEWIENPALPKA